MLPVVYNRTDSLPISDPAWQNNTAVQIQNLITPYDGVVIDINPGQGYGDFLSLLDKQVHAHGKRVDIIVRGLELDSYDLPNLSRYADMIWFAPGDNPTLYLPGGQVAQTLDVLVGLVGRDKVGLMVGTGNVEVVGSAVHTVTMEEALLQFGGVQPIDGYLNAGVPLSPGDALAMRLSGQVESFGFDEGLAMNYLTYVDTSGQTHYVYFASPQNLALRLSPALTYSVNTVVVSGLSNSELPDHMVDGISAFLSNQSLGNPPPLELIWRVKDPAGADLAVDQGDLTLLQYLWQAVSQPGQYLVSAGLRHDQTESEISQLQVEVGNPVVVAATPTPTSTPAQGGALKPGGTPSPTPVAAAVPVSGSIAAGAFEVGGQTNGTGSFGVMHSAGMTWVKFQHKWSPGESPSSVADLIQQAHGAGLKVLISIPGTSHPTSIDYTAYASFVQGVASLGADGIEIWNEMNLQREWPMDQMNGATYTTQLLMPAYQAIKSAHPDTLVIAGALAPTGFWGLDGCGYAGSEYGCSDYLFLTQMRDAGAGNYMDCLGAHYNEGIIPPSQQSGDPRDYDYYTRYLMGNGMLNVYYSVIGKPLCFTELGYLTGDGYGSLPPAFGWASTTSVGEQAQWLADAAVLLSQSGKARLMIIFNVDFTVWGDDPQAGYAIIRPGGGCPACSALAAVQP
jgi:hypothetical protein